jgi:hypothetical protein
MLPVMMAITVSGRPFSRWQISAASLSTDCWICSAVTRIFTIGSGCWSAEKGSS